jgi:serine acetyltransferase
MWNFLNTLALDAKFYCRLKYPERTASWWRLIFVILQSRGLWLLAYHRIAYISTMHKNYRKPGWWLARGCESIGRFRNMLMSKSEFRGDCDIGVPVYLSDKGFIICGAQSIGAGSMIHDHVTFGNAVGSGKKGRPRIGANVWIGPKCIFAGSVTIGDGSTILPGTYLSYDVPPGSVVQGNPARIIIKSGFDNHLIRNTLKIVNSISADKND